MAEAAPETFNERIVARIRTLEDGSLSNRKVERYALLRAEEVITPNAAWALLMTSAKGHLPGGNYQANVHKSPAFKRRLETLMAEKTELESKGVWGQIEWQARQIWRRACAIDDLRAMQQATDTLLKIAQRDDKPAPKEKPDDDAAKRGPGAPVVETPDPAASVPNYRAEKLLAR